MYRNLNEVRNRILDWTLVLEENGIVSEGVTFTDLEKETAKSANVINNYTNNFYSSVNDMDISQG